LDEIDRQILEKQKKLTTANMMLDDDGVSKTLKMREPFPRWMFARLKYKCSITLLSLLEARKNDDNVLRLMKSLNLDIMKRNCIDIFNMFKD
jgi:hypothetical protein